MRHLLDCAFFREVEGLEIAGVVSSSPTAPALVRGRNMKVPCYVVDRQLFPNAASYGMALLNLLKDIDTDFVVLDGFTAELGQVAKHYAGKVIGVTVGAEAFSTETVCTMAVKKQVGSVDAAAYLADGKGKVGTVLKSMTVEIPSDETAEALSERVFTCAELPLLMGAVEELCRKR